MPTPLRVLILEDSPTDAEVMLGHLREAGYAPVWRRVETEAEFVAHLEPTLDLILIDYTLPDFNGPRALEILRDRGWGIPSIIVTGAVSEETALELLRLGAADYLLEDRLARLGAAVRTALAHRTLQHERAAVEAAWQASDARTRFLADVLEKSAQPFGVSYPDGRMGICNAALCTLLGYTEAELRALHWSRDLTPPKWHASEAERLVELQRTGQPVRYEKECLRKDGSCIPVEVLVHLVHDIADSAHYYCAFVTDLAERKRAEAALRESEERYRLLFETSIDAILLAAPDGRILAANPEACRIFGRSEEEICQAGRAGLVDPASPRLPDLLEERARTGKTRGELIFVRKDGIRFPGEISSAVFRDRDDTLKTSMIIRDLTERKRVEKALQESENRYRHLSEAAFEGVVIHEGGVVLSANEQFCHMFGYELDELVGRQALSLTVTPEARDILRQQIATGGQGPYEAIGSKKDGTRFAMEIRARETGYEGRAVRIATVRDITPYKRTEEALVQRARQLEAVGAVSAEITRELDLRTLLDLIARRATSLLGAGSGTVWLWDEAGQVLVPAVWPGLGEWRKDCRYHLGEGVAGAVAQRRTGLLVNEYRTSPHAHPATLAHSRITAVVAEPLLYRNRLVGVLAINNEGTERSFTEGERALLALFANQAAIAIENARLYTAEQERRRQVEAVQAVSAEVTREADLNAVLRLVTQRAAELLATAAGTVFLWEEESQSLVPQAQFGQDWPATLSLRLGEGVAGAVAERREGMIVNAYRTSRYVLPAVLEQSKTTAVVAEPLLYRDRLLGVIDLSDRRPDRSFTEHDRGLLRLFANHAATAIENARLLESARLRAQQLATLNELTRTLAVTRNIQAVAREILAAVQILIPGTVGQLWELVNGAEMFRLLAFDGTRMPEAPFRAQFPAGEGLAGLAGSTRRYVTSPDVTRDVRFVNQAWAAAEGLVSCITLPLVHQERLHGSLVILTRTPHTFREPEIDLLQAFAAHAAVALENAKLFHTISERRAEVHALSAQLAEAEEGERKRLARELHDQVGQNLTALGINLNILRSQAGATGGPEVLSRLEDSFKLVDQTTERIRDVMGELRPPVLDDYGLVAALRWYAEQFSSRTQILAEVQGEEPAPRLRAPVEIALFRIAQEALTNVAKHAAVTRVRVGVETTDAAVRLVIADDGAGFDPSRLEDRPRWGLMTMRERAKAVGGQCTIDSYPGKGTSVVVEVPR
jgi:PAS domain S-box-containing protein